MHWKRRKLFFNSVVKRIRGIIKKKTVQNGGGREGKKVSTFANDGHAKKRRSSDEREKIQTKSNSHILKNSR